jgi:Arc/MetJ-type ribon-helix-helix transcriptional regulator
MRYIDRMKTSQLPPVRVTPAVREEIEAVLQAGESLSAFVEAATLEAARQRKAQAAFLARGRASLDEAKRTGEFYAADTELQAMRARLEARMQALRHAQPETPQPR